MGNIISQSQQAKVIRLSRKNEDMEYTKDRLMEEDKYPRKY